MQFEELKLKALEIRKEYSEKEIQNFGKSWDKNEIFQGLVGDIGDLSKLMTAKAGLRKIENADQKFAEELCDILWAVIILADLNDINLEEQFIKSMDHLENRINNNEQF